MQDGLAAEIADDLLADRGAAVAPTLQILLSKLWERARARNYSAPYFDQDLYHELRQQGLLLRDFLEQQLAQLQNTNDDALLTGLTLDFLAFHTTPLGTADQRTRSELREAYRHQSELLTDLLRVCQDLYLLTDSSANQPAAEPATRLSHDTLAPLVRVRFDESDAPGQRARRILENRVVDWQGSKSGLPLDEADLALVEAGLAGMRGLTADEERLVTASREEWRRKEAERQRLATEKAAAQERELVLQRQSNQRLQLVVGILLVLSLGLIGNLLYPRYMAWQTRGPLIPIDGGVALIGTDDPTAELAEQPQITVTLPSYAIEQYEVENWRYRRCVDIGPCTPPADSRRLYDDKLRSHPVVDITAIQASTYCRWIGRRLPTEIEWEYAARRAANNSWLWDPVPPRKGYAHMPVDDYLPEDTIAVTTMMASDTLTQPAHLVGNVWEWTLSYERASYEGFDPTYHWDGESAATLDDSWLALRGGGWDIAITRITERHIYSATDNVNSYGFRCVQ